jgi:hypothetical protein
MINARRLYHACFHAAVAISQAFVAGVAVAVCGMLGLTAPLAFALRRDRWSTDG